MSVKPIVLYPDHILRKSVKRVQGITSFERGIIRDLIDTMAVQPGGIGIAAPQIGYDRAIAVIDVSSREKGKKRLILVNPELLTGEGAKIGREGCMSLPHHTGNVSRYERVTVHYHDEDFKVRQIAAAGIEAICLQHELDHLNGYLFLDRVHSVARDVFRRKVYRRHPPSASKK
ncbi:MAG: peptide deformylase [Candidatus Omnitrophica bacterium CG11_big_fil_rev_8_21_14_0_20_45_26]|uniref:Peptide deformylase n=1 Tax=Candidatus Abzuiibacterium crystallinum TaxID=1974748 RepID=A0A2H0LSB0_9BACT|nr:MAG: peptide deformylase [Candidatus Omnitrophica bacterium CG11_big_fil_rev_8_21_14_0_20_45_26]PIW65005.1 MAG: peptide deformylase [Candidatus Omnitrophica bacterium CG12_big_fil_rev_8_21_14_0_65_45_16]